jgi:hypothetical protein
VNCLAFERLLDSGEPDALPAAALAHARDCATCSRALARARALEHALELQFASGLEPEPALEETLERLTQRVMARVDRGEARGVRWLALPDALPWWVRAAAEPGVLLASVVAALLLWRGDVLLAAVRAWTPLAEAAPARWMAWAQASPLAGAGRTLAQALLPGPGEHWGVALGLLLGMAPLFALLALPLWRAGERLVDAVGAASQR